MLQNIWVAILTLDVQQGQGLTEDGEGLLPGDLSRALGITLYAMFIAILIPNCQKSKKVFAVTAAAGILGCVFYYLPLLSQLSSGWTIIIISVLVSAVAAALECRREGARP